MKKPIIHAPLYRKADRYEPHRCIVEKAVTIPHSEFEQMRQHPIRDSTYIKEYKDLMYYADDADHCVLFIDEDSGDGILVQAEGYDYARYSQFVPDARGLMETASLTEAEMKIHGHLREVTDIIAERTYKGEKYHSVSNLLREICRDFDKLLQQAVVEMLQERADIKRAERMPITNIYQADLFTRPQERHKIRLITPLKIEIAPDEIVCDKKIEQVHPKQAVNCQREINDFIERYAEQWSKFRGLMTYYDKDSSVSEKVFSAFPSVEVVNGELVGVLTCEVCGRMEQAEMAEFLRWWHSQCAEGSLDMFSLYEIKTAEFGGIYVNFWNDSPDWSITTEEEANEDIAAYEEEGPEVSDISMCGS